MPPRARKKAAAAKKDMEYVQIPTSNRGRSRQVLLRTQTPRQTRSSTIATASQQSEAPVAVTETPQLRHIASVMAQAAPPHWRKLVAKSRTPHGQNGTLEQIEEAMEIELDPTTPGDSTEESDSAVVITKGHRTRGKGHVPAYKQKDIREDVSIETDEPAELNNVGAASGDDEYLYETGTDLDLEEFTREVLDDEEPDLSPPSTPTSDEDDISVLVKRPRQPVQKTAAKPKPVTGKRKTAKTIDKVYNVITDNGCKHADSWYEHVLNCIHNSFSSPHLVHVWWS